MVHTIFFDLDDTLLDFHASERKAISRTLSELGIDPTPETTALYSAINARQWQLLELGELTREQVLIRRFALLFEALGIDHAPEDAQALYGELLSQGCDLIPGALELLEQLAPEYALYLMSNGNAVVQDRRLALSGIGHYFKDIFISQRIGFDKPRVEFFQHCFARIPDFDPAGAIIVGDSLSSDMQGGLNAGLRTCWYNPHGKSRDIPVTWEITALEELPPLLARI